MADIASGSLNMAAADLAADAIQGIVTSQVAPIIDQCAAEGSLSNTRAKELKAKGAAVASRIVSLINGYHGDLIEAAKAAGIDLPPPANGQQALIDFVQGMILPAGGGR